MTSPVSPAGALSPSNATSTVPERIEHASFRGASLSGRSFKNVALSACDFLEADCSHVDFSGAALKNCCFRNATLRAANFAGTTGTATCDFGGADLRFADLPNCDFKELNDRVLDSAKQLRTVFHLAIAACAFVALSIGTTRDVDLLTNSSSSQLPILNLSVPLGAFYLAAPILIIAVHLYYLSLLEASCELIGALPRAFPDGRSLYHLVDPGLIASLLRSSTAGAGKQARLLLVAVTMEWALVPTMLVGVWYRYLSRQDVPGTALHIILIGLVVSLSLESFADIKGRLAQFRLTSGRAPGRRHAWVPGAIGAAVIIILVVASAAAFSGRFAVAKLARVEVSQRPTLGQSSPKPAELNGARLVGADVREAYLAGASMLGVRADRADFTAADLRDARLNGASLTGASLRAARLEGADLTSVDLRLADLRGARLSASTKISDKWRVLSSIVNHSDVGFDLIGLDFSDAMLDGADFGKASLAHADFSRSLLRKAQFSAATLVGARFDDADLGNAILTRANMREAVLTGANLSGARLDWVDLKDSVIDAKTTLDQKWMHVWQTLNVRPPKPTLTGLDFSDAALRGADLTGARIESTTFAGADLSGARLSGVTFVRNVDFGGATLRGADLRGSNLCGTLNLSSEQLASACVDERTLGGLRLCRPTLADAVAVNCAAGK